MSTICCSTSLTCHNIICRITVFPTLLTVNSCGHLRKLLSDLCQSVSLLPLGRRSHVPDCPFPRPVYNYQLVPQSRRLHRSMRVDGRRSNCQAFSDNFAEKWQLRCLWQSAARVLHWSRAKRRTACARGDFCVPSNRVSRQSGGAHINHFAIDEIQSVRWRKRIRGSAVAERPRDPAYRLKISLVSDGW